MVDIRLSIVKGANRWLLLAGGGWETAGLSTALRCASVEMTMGGGSATELEPGLITVAEGQHLHGRVPTEVRLEGVKYFSHTARSQRLDNRIH
jgi:hypothetical protein